MSSNQKSKEFWDKIAGECRNTNSLQQKCLEIAERENINIKYLYKKLEDKYNIDTRYFRKCKSDKTWDKIIKECIETSCGDLENPVYLQDIAKKYNVCTATINAHLKERDINLNVHHRRKHKFDERFFEIIDCELKAYLLGFIMADGCVSMTNSKYNKVPNRLTVNISDTDREILVMLRNAIKSNDINIETRIPKNTYSDHPMSRLVVNSQKMCSDLSKYGIVERKTGKECIPDNIPKELVRHFIRGFFDGDGTVFHINSGKQRTVGFTSNNKMLQQIKQLFQSELKLISVMTLFKDAHNNQKVYDVRIHTSSDITKIYDYFYKDASYYLKRKFDKF
jgi:hypothetical protein